MVGIGIIYEKPIIIIIMYYEKTFHLTLNINALLSTIFTINTAFHKIACIYSKFPSYGRNKFLLK